MKYMVIALSLLATGLNAGDSQVTQDPLDKRCEQFVRETWDNKKKGLAAIGVFTVCNVSTQIILARSGLFSAAADGVSKSLSLNSSHHEKPFCCS